MHPQKLFLREDDNMTCNIKLRRILHFFFFDRKNNFINKRLLHEQRT